MLAVPALGEVEGTASSEAIIEAVEKAGYGASPKEAVSTAKKADFSAEEEMLKDHETPVLKKRLFASKASFQQAAAPGSAHQAPF